MYGRPVFPPSSRHWLPLGKPQCHGSCPCINPGGSPACRRGDYISGDDVLSADLISPQGLQLGEIEDLAIDWQNSQPGAAQVGQFGYLVLDLDSDLGVGDLMVPVPWRLIPGPVGQDNLVVNLTPNILQTAPNFPGGILPDLYAEPQNSQLTTFWTGKEVGLRPAPDYQAGHTGAGSGA